MAIGLYKPGHGYWVRVLTATMLGIVTLATAAWTAQQMVLLVASLPRSAWEVSLREVSGAPQPGTRVDLLSSGDAPADRRVLGTAEVSSYDATNRFLVLRRPTMTGEADPSQARYVGATGGATGEGAVGFAGAVEGTPRGAAVVEPLYVQGGAGALVILVGAGLVYMLVGLKPKTVDFLIATDMEMKKVNWSTRKDIIGSTWVVIGAAFLISLFLFMFDLFFRWFFSMVGVVAS